MAINYPKGVWCSIGRDETIPIELANNMGVVGVGMGVNWSEIERVEGNFDWTPLDTRISNALDAGFNDIAIAVTNSPFDAPTWLLDDIEANTPSEIISLLDPAENHDTFCVLMRHPVWWNERWREARIALVNAMAAKYANHPNIRAVFGSGFNHHSMDWNNLDLVGTVTCPPCPQDPPRECGNQVVDQVQQWLDAGWDRDLVLASLKEYNDAVAAAFPNQAIKFPIGGLGVSGQDGANNPLASTGSPDPWPETNGVANYTTLIREITDYIFGNPALGINPRPYADRVFISRNTYSRNTPTAQELRDRPPNLRVEKYIYKLILDHAPQSGGQAVASVAMCRPYDGTTACRMNGQTPADDQDPNNSQFAIFQGFIDGVVGYGVTYLEPWTADCQNPLFYDIIRQATIALGGTPRDADGGGGGGGGGGGEPPPPPTIEALISVRKLKFRDVVWGVAHKMGWIASCDPITGGPSNDEFCELVSSANAWVRRLWDVEDFPEWTKILEATPDDNHFIANPGRPLRLFLTDPNKTPGPIDSPFTFIDARVHCGFEHGSTVFLKYIPNAPAFTDEKWSADATYKTGDLVYSPVSGECYRSLIDGNHGNDPARELLLGITSIDPVVEQRFDPGHAGIPPTDEVWRIQIVPFVLGEGGQTRFVVEMIDHDVGEHHEVEFIATTTTISDVLDGLEAAFGASGDTFVQSLTFAQEAPDKFTLTLSTNRFSAKGTYDETPGSPPPPTDLPLEHLSVYDPGRSGVDPIPQIVTITLPSEFDLVPAIWTITATDTARATHRVTYNSPRDETLETTLHELMQAIRQAATSDPWWGTVVTATDPDTLRLEFTTLETVRFDARVEPRIDPNAVEPWDQVLFPLALAESVMDGMYQDALRAEGQTDKALAETQTTAQDVGLITGKQQNQAYDKYTDQQKTGSRYRM